MRRLFPLCCRPMRLVGFL